MGVCGIGREVMIIGALVMVHARMFGIMRKLYLIFPKLERTLRETEFL